MYTTTAEQAVGSGNTKKSVKAMALSFRKVLSTHGIDSAEALDRELDFAYRARSQLADLNQQLSMTMDLIGTINAGNKRRFS